MRLRTTTIGTTSTAGRRPLAVQAQALLTSLLAQGVPVVNQLIADQWAYQQRALAAFPGVSSKCVLFQDAAGTVPVTALDQPVGLALDMSTAGQWDGVSPIASLPGTHMVQAVVAKRATLSARINQSQTSEVFGAWTKFRALTNGRLLIEDTANNSHFMTQAQVAWPANAGVVARYRVRPVGNRGVAISFTTAAGWVGGNASARFVLSGAGSVLSVTSGSTASIQRIAGTDDYLCEMRSTVGSAAISASSYPALTDIAGNITYQGDGASGIEIVWTDTRLAAHDAPGVPIYQRVTSVTEYDAVGFPVFLRADGTDDAYQSASTFNLTMTDGVSVFSPCLKTSDATVGTVLELSPSSSTGNNGVFAVFAPADAATANAAFRSGATAMPIVKVSALAAPRKSLLTGIGRIGSDTALLRVQGAQAATSSLDQGVGNYGNHTLYALGRAASSLYFKGDSGGFLIIGRTLTDNQAALIERYINQSWRSF